MNDIQVFDNGDFTVRTINDNGEIWFVAKDVLHALGYAADTQPSGQLRNVPEIWTGVKRLHTSSANGVIQEREMLCLTEQGLYFFLGRSDKPKALPYQMWIAGEVLPSIRKTGSYSLEGKPTVIFDPMQSAKLIFEVAGIKSNQLALALDKVYKTYTGQSALLAGEIQLEAPVKEQALTPSQIAEAIGMGKGKSGGRQVNALLDSFGFQHRIAGNWEPADKGLDYAVVVDTNKKHSNGTPVRQIKWNSSIVPVLKHLIYD